MLSKFIRFISVSIGLLLIVCAYQFGKLYVETTPSFKDISVPLSQHRDIQYAEKLIGKISFNPTIKIEMKPADFLARETLLVSCEEKLLTQQIKRLILARRLNNTFSEDRLLSFWLSTVYFGEGDYGLEKTAKNLFNKNIETLTQGEAIALAALIKTPSRFRSDPVQWKKEQDKLMQILGTTQH